MLVLFLLCLVWVICQLCPPVTPFLLQLPTSEFFFILHVPGKEMGKLRLRGIGDSSKATYGVRG